MKGVVIQYGCSTFLALMCGINAFCNVWPSYAINMLQSDNSTLGYKISQNVANLIGSLPMLGSLVATIVAGHVADGIGRKRTMVLSGLLYTVAWSLIVSARSNVQILFARFLMGVSSGISCVVVLIYTSEITDLSIRGSTTCLSSLLYNGGVMASYLEGWFCSYNAICYINLTFLVVYVILMSFLKDTPSYLLKIGNDKEALKSLKFYRGQSESTPAILEELAYIKQHLKSGDNDAEKAALTEKEKLEKEENTESKNGWILLFTVPHHRRAIISSLVFVILVGSMGMVAVQTYASQFFKRAAPGWSPDLCSVIFSLILVLSNLLTVIVTDLFPRRTLMISNCFLTTLCLATLGCSMRWSSTPTWVVLLAVLVFCLVFHLGVINIVFVQLSECYEPKMEYLMVLRSRNRRSELQRQKTLRLHNAIRDVTDPFMDPHFQLIYRLTPELAKRVIDELRSYYPLTSYANAIPVEIKVNGPAAVLIFGAMFLANFVVLSLFVPAVDTIGIDNTFFVFTAIAAFTTVLSYFWIQETRRVPLEEIQRIYEQGITYKRVSVIEK